MAAIVQHNGQTELLDMTREDVEVHRDSVKLLALIISSLNRVGEGGGGVPSYGLYRYGYKGYGCQKEGIDFGHFSLKWGIAFSLWS